MKKKRARAEPASKGSDEPTWSQVTLADLEDWAGSRALSKGSAYLRSGAVSELGISADGELVAWVAGSARYATRVRCVLSRAGRRTIRNLGSSCSCPVGIRCKHAVATVLAALARLADGEVLPRAADDDVRWTIAAGISGGATAVSFAKHRDLATYLNSLEKAELVEILLETCAQRPEIEAELEHRRALSGGDLSTIVQRIREEIVAVSGQSAWRNSWSREGHLPDYTRVQSGLEQLLGDGHADAVIELARKLFALGHEQVGRSHDDGETASAIGACLSVASRALLQCSLSDPEKILYAIDMSAADEYQLADGIAAITDRKWSKQTWSAVADAMGRRLEASTGEDIVGRYRRQRTSDWLVSALDSAGREAEALQVCEDEARRHGSYERLVERLIDAKRLDEARAWAERGYAAVVQEYPGTAWRLHTTLSDLARRRRQWPLVAAYEAEQFFIRPDVPTFNSLLAAANRAGCQVEVRAAAERFLETGKRPAGSDEWPLPSTGLPPSDRRRTGFGRAEHWDVLQDLAIEEGRPDDVLRWRDRMASSGGSGFWRSDEADVKVAHAVAATHPERAIEIYRAVAERIIDAKNAKAYLAAGKLLQRLRATLDASRRSSEWPGVVAELRESHGRKRRFMEVLAGLERKPIACRKRSRS